MTSSEPLPDAVGTALSQPNRDFVAVADDNVDAESLPEPAALQARAVPGPSVAGPASTLSSPPTWRGAFEPFSVGDPGSAWRRVVAAPTPLWPDRRDTVVDGFTVRGSSGADALHIRAASVRGLSHRYYGAVRQDEYAIRHTATHIVVAVADGVGTLPMSHIAAELATQVSCDEVVRQLAEGPQIDWPLVFRAAGSAILQRGAERMAEVDGCPDVLPSPSDVAAQMATTIRVAAVDTRRGDAGLPVTLQGIGDTSAWVLGRDGSWRPTGLIKNAGATIASSAVSALPFLPTEFEEPVSFELLPGEALAVMTDGVSDPLGDGAGEVGIFLAESWRTPPRPLAFAAQIDMARKTFDDDRTVICLWPSE
jgi:hypothetical protein